MQPDVHHPGMDLQQCFLQPLGITPTALAKAIGVPRRRVFELIKGRRPITQDMAARLALYFDVPARWWLELQARYDAAHLPNVEELRQVVVPYPGLADVLVTPHGVTHLAPATEPRNERPTATYSEQFLARLRAQVALTDPVPRQIAQKTFSDGSVALVGE